MVTEQHTLATNEEHRYHRESERRPHETLDGNTVTLESLNSVRLAINACLHIIYNIFSYYTYYIFCFVLFRKEKFSKIDIVFFLTRHATTVRCIIFTQQHFK